MFFHFKVVTSKYGNELLLTELSQMASALSATHEAAPTEILLFTNSTAVSLDVFGTTYQITNI